MQTWKDQMDAQRAEQERLRAERAAQQAQLAQQKFATRFYPMRERIRKILKHMPREVQQEGVSLELLRSNLAGKYRGQAAPREVAAGLRELGWERRRNWTKDGPFIALWYPPSGKTSQSPTAARRTLRQYQTSSQAEKGSETI